MGKLKYSEIKDYRDQLLKKQGYKCALCNKRLLKSEAHLDHDHKTGKCRAALHPTCNQLLGKIENFTRSYGKDLVTKKRLQEFLNNTYKYMTGDYKHQPLHPKHRTKRRRRK